MTPAERREVDQLFIDAFDLDPLERARYLDSACVGREHVRKEVEALLAIDSRLEAHEQTAASKTANTSSSSCVLGWEDDASDEEFADHPGERDRHPGQVPDVFGGYEILAEIARGGMGVVYKARQVNLDRVVALKMIRSGRFAGEDEVKRFLREARAAATLQHPNIVSIHEVGDQDGQHYFAMDYVEGKNLAELVRSQSLPARTATEYVRTIARAVHYAHQRGILHRDLKPANVLIDASGEPRVTDFGLAKRIEGEADLTASGALLGTPSYMPPEQAAGNRHLDATCDVYSLGATLYELLVGRPPFLAESALATLKQVMGEEPVPPRRLNNRIPRELETVCLKCLEKDPKQRYASASELADELHRFLKGEPIRARPISPLTRGWRWCRRNAVLSAVSLSAVVIIMAINGFYYFRLTAEIVKSRKAEIEARGHLARSLYEQASSVLASPKPSSCRDTLELLRRAEEARSSVEEARRLTPTAAGGSVFTGLPELADLRGKALEALLAAPALLKTEIDLAAGASPPLPAGCVLQSVVLSRGSRVAALAWSAPHLQRGGVRVFDLAAGQELRRIEHTMEEAIGDLEALSDDGRRIITLSPRAGLRLWELPDGGGAASLLRFSDLASTVLPLPADPSDGYCDVWDFRASADFKYVAAIRRWWPDRQQQQQQAMGPQWMRGQGMGGQWMRRQWMRRLGPAASTEVITWETSSSAAPALQRLDGDFTSDIPPPGALVFISNTLGSARLLVPGSSGHPMAIEFPSPIQPCVAMGGNGGLAAAITGSPESRALLLCDLEKGESRKSGLLPPGCRPPLALSPDGSLVAVAQERSGWIAICPVGGEEQGRAPREFQADTRDIGDLAWLANGQDLMTRAADGPLRIWTLLDPSLCTFLPAGTGPRCPVAFNSALRQVAMAPASGKEGVQILELATGAPVRVLRSGSKLEGAVKELSFSGDGLHLAAWSRAEVIVWKPATGEVEARLEFQLEQEGKSASRFHSVLTSAGFDRRGHLVACGRRRKGDSNLVGLWNATTSEPVLEFPEGSTEFSHIYLSPGGESALALVPGGWIAHVVEIPGGRTLGVWKASSRRRIVDAESATFSPDGRWVAFCNRVDEPASALRAGEPVHGIPPPDDVEEPDPEAEVGGVSKDERALPGLSLWTLPDGRESLALRTPSEPLCIAFSPDARFVAAGCIDGSLLLWEIKGATLLVHSGVRTGPLLHLAFAPEAALAYGDGRSPLVTIHLDALRVHLARRGLGW